jgi:hypothetical protein
MTTLIKPEQKTRSLLQPIAQVAFDLGMLYIASQAYIYIWRITTGH